MITQHGPLCDVCDQYILFDISINPFSVSGCEHELHCHDACKPKVIAAMEAKDFTLLPTGRLRRAYEEQAKP